MRPETNKFLTHPPMRPLPTPSTRARQPGGAFHVDASGGDDANSGGERAPWKTIAHALEQLGPGDTLYLRGGVYYECVRISVVGQPDAPITIRSFPGELAVIDGGFREFFEAPQRAWERVSGSVPDYYRSTRPYRNIRCVLGWFGDSMVPLMTYQQRVDIEETGRIHFEQIRGKPFPLPVYLGPGLHYDSRSGHIFARLTPTNYNLGYPGFADYRGVTDPRETPIVISPYSSLPLHLDGAEHVVLQDLGVRGGGENTVLVYDSQYVTFDNVVVYCGTYGLRSTSSGPVRFLHSALRGSVSPWFVHAAGCLRNIPGPRKRHEPESGRYTMGRDVTRLNTHVLAAIEGRTEEMVNYAFPGNHHWEFAHSDFTDGFDGIHLGGECIEFHHNRVDRFFDDSIYLTPLTPRYLDQVHIYQNLFTRCLLPIGFGGLSEPGGPIYIYRNVIDSRTGCMASHGKLFRNITFVGHFRDVDFFHFGALHIYQNTIVSHQNPRLGQSLTQDVLRAYGLTTLAFTNRDWPRRVFNNLFVHLDGMVPPDPRSLPRLDEDVQVDGNVHWDLVNPGASAEKLERYKRSAFFEKTRAKYPDGWEAQARVGDPRFVAFAPHERAPNDYRIREGSAAAGAGVVLPAHLDDPLRPTDGRRPDAGAFPLGADPMRVGREIPPGARDTYGWLEETGERP
jgi:hypothetical protein